MQNKLIGMKMWAVSNGDTPICLNETKEGAKRSLDNTFDILVELEVVKAGKACVHFLDCDQCTSHKPCSK